MPPNFRSDAGEVEVQDTFQAAAFEVQEALFRRGKLLRPDVFQFGDPAAAASRSARPAGVGASCACAVSDSARESIAPIAP